MKTIFKYGLTPDDEVHIAMPQGAVILSCQTQGDFPVIWALVDPERPGVTRRFYVCPTGAPVPPRVASDLQATDGPRFLSTIQLAGGALVFHIFYDPER